MKVIIAILAFLMLGQAHAQTTQVDQQGDAVSMQPAQSLPGAPKKRTVLYDERTGELVEVQPDVATAEAQPAVTASPIYILNNQKYQGYQGTNQAATQNHVQEQPVTVVNDSPIKASASDQMRKTRQDAETVTEDGIVQALEKARMEDEIRRRDRFNGAIGTGAAVENNATQTATQIQVVQPVQAAPIVVQKVVPAPVAAEVEEEEVVEYKPKKKAKYMDEEEEKVDIRSEIRAAVKESMAQPEQTTQHYVSGLVGMGKYPDVVNVRGNVATGVLAGMVTPDRFVAEMSFIYADYELEDMWRSNPYNPAFPRIVDMRQYNFGAAVKYQLLPGKLRPNIGAMVNYTRRSFSETNYDFRTSDAFDIGVVTGIDLQLTNSFAIGFDFRYATNVAYRENTEYRTSFVNPQARNEIEKLDYYTGTLSGKFTF